MGSKYDYHGTEKQVREMALVYDTWKAGLRPKRGQTLRDVVDDDGVVFECGCKIDNHSLLGITLCDTHHRDREDRATEDHPTMVVWATEIIDRNWHTAIVSIDTHPGIAVYHFLTAVQEALFGNYGSSGKMARQIRVTPFLLNHFYGHFVHPECLLLEKLAEAMVELDRLRGESESVDI